MDASRDELARLVDWSRLNQPTGEARVDNSTPSPIEHRTASPLVNITRDDIAKAMDTAMAFSGGGLGIKAYHGSPHDFSQFDLGKIGTGEGAQAYGHGLYFAEHEPVAKGYRDTLSKNRKLVGDEPFNPDNVSHSVAELVHEHGGDLAAARATLMKEVEIATAGGAGPLSPLEQRQVAEALQLLSQGNIPKLTSGPVKGHMYEVDINAHPEQFLDWDKPIGAMSDKIRERVPDYGGYARAINPDASGQAAYRGLSQMAGKSGASNLLLEAGIPGIKYLDEGSRSAAGQVSINRRILNDPNVPHMHEQARADLEKAMTMPQTSNYVVRNADIIKIMRKYGIAGAAPVGLGTLATGDREE